MSQIGEGPRASSTSATVPSGSVMGELADEIATGGDLERNGAEPVGEVGADQLIEEDGDGGRDEQDVDDGEARRRVVFVADGQHEAEHARLVLGP